MIASIIIPVYNQGQYLAEAIDSALSQNLPGVEVIVVDDGSTDNSLEVTKFYGNRITLIHQENKGVPIARNAGAKISTGEFLLFLDSDDWISYNYLSKTIPLMTEGVGVVSTDMQYFGVKSDLISPLGMTLEIESQSNQLPVCSLIRREAFPGYNSFKTIFGMEDWDLWLGIMEGGWKVAVLNEPLFYYRVHAESMCHKETLLHREMTIRAVKRLHPNSCRDVLDNPTKRFLVRVLDKRLIEKNGEYAYLLEKHARQMQQAGKVSIIMEE